MISNQLRHHREARQTVAHALANINVLLPVKTTKPVDWIKRGVEEYLDVVEANYPQLAGKVSKVTVEEIRGNPHPTPYQNGPNDPFHGSGAIGAKNLKRDDRETSLHIYPNEIVKPTNEKWPTLQVTAAAAEELGEDAVWLDPNYCEDYASGRSNAGETSEDKYHKGKGKGKASSSSSSAGGVSSGWEWDNEMQMTSAGLRILRRMCIGTRVLRLKSTGMARSGNM